MNPDEYLHLSRCEEQHWWYRSLRKSLLTLLDQAPPTFSNQGIRRALDIGCGTGALARSLGALGYDVTAIDISTLAIAELQKRSLAIQTAVADANTLPFADNSFDLVVCIDVLECQAVSPRQAATEAFRVLKPGGIGIFQAAAHQWLLSEHDRAVHSVRRFNLRDFRLCLQGPGVELLRATYLFFFLFPLMASWKLLRRPRFDSPIETAKSDVSLPHPMINSFLYLLSAIEALMLRFVDLPLGTSACIVARKKFVPESGGTK